MHPRYSNPEITKIFSDESKLSLWQDVELAVLQARVNLKLLPLEIYREIFRCLKENPIDLDWWKKRDQEIGHDLNAFLDERLRFLPEELHQYFHAGMTSYDTEESPFVINLKKSLEIVGQKYRETRTSICSLAKKYRYTIMMARTHGQPAELQSFGKRALTWHQDCEVAYNQLLHSMKMLEFSKLSGAIGNYSGLDPDVEIQALNILGFSPYYGATQIMPRVIYAQIAQTLCNLALVLDKIALDIRLCARGGHPLMQEPFGKKQKGSSAMPQKKNPINLEQMEGLMRLIKAYMQALTENIVTWEERAIEQSCVERVAWPDLFHAVIRMLTVMQKTLSQLTVYPDNMLEEILDSRGTYAASEVKEFLKRKMTGFTYEDVYRLVQVACFNAFEPTPERLKIKSNIPTSHEVAYDNLKMLTSLSTETHLNIKEIIENGSLAVSAQLDISADQIRKFNYYLDRLFHQTLALPENRKEWEKIFTPAYLLRNENKLYFQIIGE